MMRCKIIGKSVCLEHHTSHWYTLSSALTHKHYYFLYPKCSLSCHRWWTKILSYMLLYLFIPSTGFVYSKVYNSIKVARIQRQVIYYSIYSNITWCYACNKGSTFKIEIHLHSSLKVFHTISWLSSCVWLWHKYLMPLILHLCLYFCDSD